MAKFLQHDGQGGTQEVTGNATSTGVADAGKIVQLDSNGRLDNSLMPTGIGADTQTVVASEALSAGDLVNIYNNSGTANARKADASAGLSKQAHGFVKVTVASGAQATVFFEGNNDAATGLTPGNQFLSTTPGKSTTTPSTTAGHIVQKVGVATSTSNLNFESFNPVTLG